MNNLTLGIISLALALFGVVLRKTYFSVPINELKRRAQKNEPHAKQLYKAAVYGNSLRSLLWLYIGLTSAASIILLARVLPVWLGLFIVGPVLWITFSLLPASRTTDVGIWLTKITTPFITWLLNYVHPLLSRTADTVERHYSLNKHTKLFERSDLIQLIEDQQRQADSRISEEELEIVKRALKFDAFKVRDILIPRKAMKIVQADDTVGPVLIDEIHKSQQGYTLVRDGKKGPFVGVIVFSELNLKSSGKVRDIMDPTIYYLHESDTLSEALHAFFVTNYPLFVIVNSFEEYVGVITISSVLHKLLGHIPGDDFDQYTDLSAVAMRHSNNQRTSLDSHETPVNAGDEVIE